MTATDMDARRSRVVMLAIGVLIASQQAVAPPRLCADEKQEIATHIAQLDSPDAKARLRAAAMLYKMASSATPPREALADAVVPLFMAYTEKRERTYSPRALQAIGAPAIAKLIPLLQHEKRDVRRGVCSRIRSMVSRDPAVGKAMSGSIAPLIAALADEDRSVAQSVSKALLAIGPPAVKQLIAALRHKKMSVRIGSAQALADIAVKPGTPPLATAGAIAPLTAMMRETDIRARATGYRTLATVDSRRRVDILLKAFNDGDPRLCEFAVGFIASYSRGPWAKQLRDKRLIAHMTAATKAADSSLSSTAARGLKWLRDPKGMAAKAEAAMRRRDNASSARGSDADLRAAIILHQHVQRLNFARTPLKDALQFMRDHSNVNILVDWRALAKIGVASFSAVTVTARDVSVSEALRLILADVVKGKTPLRFEVIDGMIVISTPADLLAIKKSRQVEKTLRRAGGAADQAVWKKLDMRTPKIDFKGVDLKDAIQFFREYSNVNILADWRALEKIGVASSSAVTVTARNVSISEALRLILADVAKGKTPLRFEVIGGMIVISTPADLLAIKKTRQVEQSLRRAAGAADQAVWKKLDMRAPKIDFNRISLKDAIHFLRDISGVSIVLDWKALAGLGIRESSTITIKLRGPTVATTLWVMLLSAGNTRDLAIRVKNGVATMSKAGATARRPAPVPPRPTPPKTPRPPKAPPSDDTAAARMLRLADLYRSNKNTDKAVGLYRQIVKRYPKTKAADAARKVLAEIGDQ